MIHIALYEPEIPPNTGNIIRLCANTGAQLHLIHPLGFEWDDKRLRRAGLDYSEFADVIHHDNYSSFEHYVNQHHSDNQVYALSTKGQRGYTQPHYQHGDILLFGPETRGLPDAVLAAIGSANILRLPMAPNSRSLNLSNTVAITTYEAWRQLGFTNGS